MGRPGKFAVEIVHARSAREWSASEPLARSDIVLQADVTGAVQRVVDDLRARLEISMRATERPLLARVYEKLWRRLGVKGDLAEFLGD
jgi:hypothetical protein